MSQVIKSKMKHSYPKKNAPEPKVDPRGNKQHEKKFPTEAPEPQIEPDPSTNESSDGDLAKGEFKETVSEAYHGDERSKELVPWARDHYWDFYIYFRNS